MPERMRVDGGCHCGRITFDADIDPDMVRLCHCADCQVITGTAFTIAAPVEEEHFRLRSGTPRSYVKTTADSGRPRVQAFCGDCGTKLYATSVGDGPKTIGLRVGAIRQRRELAPKRQFWRGSALDWVDSIGDLPAAAQE